MNRDRSWLGWLAVLQIELCSGRPGVENPVIRRTLFRPAGSNSRRDLSKWSINNQTRTQEQVLKALAEYGVQVDNMCQFLPQDKVGEFSKFDKYELFRETVRAVLGQESIDQMEKLRNARDDGERVRKQFEDMSKELALKKEELQRMESAVEQQRERKTISEKLHVLKLKLPWLRFDKQREATKEQKDKNKVLKAELNELRRSAAPLDEELMVLKKKLRSANEKVNRIDAKRMDREKHCKTLRQKYKTACGKSKRATEALESIEDEQAEAAEKLRKTRTLVKKLEEKLETLEHPDHAKEELVQINSTMANVSE
jgi:chromosome segregation ATPase